MNPLLPAKQLDENGRCCGRKPLVYKRPPHLFCCRCNAAFHSKTGKQIGNWAFSEADGGFKANNSRIEK